MRRRIAPKGLAAVLVVATPCPLILATPVAIIGGINRAARLGIIFRHGTALEQLGPARQRRVVLDQRVRQEVAVRHDRVDVPELRVRAQVCAEGFVHQ